MTTAVQTINFKLPNGMVLPVSDPAAIAHINEMHAKGASDEEVMQFVLAFMQTNFFNHLNINANSNPATGETPVADNKTNQSKGAINMDQVKMNLAAAGLTGAMYANVAKEKAVEFGGQVKKVAVTVGTAIWKAIKWTGVKVWGYAKKRKLALAVGVGSALVAGAVTSTMSGAVMAGMGISAVAIVAIQLLLNKQRAAEQKKGFMAIASEAMDASMIAMAVPYVAVYGLLYLTKFFDAAWYYTAKATISSAILFMA